MRESKIILGLDGLILDDAIDLLGKIGSRLYGAKIHNLYDEHGPDVVKILKHVGAERVWVDAKLHDIPDTVKARAEAIAKSGADIVTVHASGGDRMMRYAKQVSGLEVFGVTVLTSLDEHESAEIYGDVPAETVPFLADMARDAGLNGIVCSGEEASLLANREGMDDLEIVVPGTRSPGKQKGNQKRSTTPAEALKAGATRLVIASQVTKSDDPVGEMGKIEDEIAAVA